MEIKKHDLISAQLHQISYLTRTTRNAILFHLAQYNKKTHWITHLVRKPTQTNTSAGNCHEPEGAQVPLQQRLYWPSKDTAPQNVTDQSPNRSWHHRKQNALHCVSRLSIVNLPLLVLYSKWQLAAWGFSAAFRLTALLVFLFAQMSRKQPCC